MATQEDLINQQFQSAMSGLQTKKNQAVDQAQMAVNRQKAMGGLTGGGAIKAQQKAQQGLEETFGANEAALRGQQGQQLQQVAAQKEAQEFTAGQAGLEREQQASQFEKTYGLQQKQFEEAQKQFQQQMNYQMTEFNENQKTNMINALTAIDKSRLTDPDWLKQLMGAIGTVNAKVGPPQINKMTPIPQGGGSGYFSL